MAQGDQGGKRRNFNYSNVMSTLSVFLVIAGGSAIAASVPKNTVTSKSVKNEALKSKDLKNGKAVASSDVIDESLTGDDIDESRLSGVAPAGPAGGGLAGQYPNPQLADNSVNSAKVTADSLVAGDLANDSVTTAEIASSTINAGDLANDSVGGLALAPDSTSSDELVEINVRQSVVSIAGATTGSQSTFCQNNEQLISGGGYVADPATMDLTSSGPNLSFPNVAWIASAQNNAGGAQNLTIVAYCLAA